MTSKSVGGKELLRFRMRVEYVGQGDHYIALGFSGNRQMANSSIVMCRSDGNVELGYTTEYRSYISLLSNYFDLLNTSVTVTNNITTCWFDRIIESTQTREYRLRNLTSPFHLLRAWGPVTNDEPVQHVARASSAFTYAYPSQVSAGRSVLPATTTIDGCLVMTLLILLLP